MAASGGLPRVAQFRRTLVPAPTLIEGTVNVALEAVVTLTVSGTSERSRRVAVVIDTGYSGDITLPPELVTDLELARVGSTNVELANGQEMALATYIATVDWAGDQRGVVVYETDSVPLVGMRLLKGHKLLIDVQRGGRVHIEPLRA